MFDMSNATIQTTIGIKHVVRRVGVMREYYHTLPTPSAPHGEWWVHNPQYGFVPVPSNGRALCAALEEDNAR
jgi:hypothetical protein